MQGQVQIRRLTKIAPVDGPVEIVMDALPYKENIRWTRIVARCLQSRVARISICLKVGRTRFLLRSEAVLDPDNSTGTRSDVFAPGNYQVCALFENPSEGDECELYAFGVVEPSDLT